MSNSNNHEIVMENYKTKNNLVTRINLHKKYDKNKKWSHWIFENYHLFEGCTILELGCGTGSMWEGNIDKLPENAILTLTDFSQGMVDVVKEKFSHQRNIKFQVMNIQEIDSQDNTYDIVIANSMLYHVPDLNKAVSEVYRVLKPNGLFYAFTFGKNGQMKFFNQKLKEFNPEISAFGEDTYTFTIQTGREVLSRQFKNIILYEYVDTLDVTDSKDIVEYILSAATMATFQKEKTIGLLEFFESVKNKDGIISIPREYGMFISQK